MAEFNSDMGFGGRLGVRKISVPKAPLAWRVKNALRFDYALGLAGSKLAKAVSALTGIPVMTSELSAVLIRADGSMVNYGVVSRRVITTAFVNFVVDQLQTETSVFGDFKHHDSGVGTTAAAITDTAIETTDGESRATGTQVEGASANIYRSVGTITYTSSLAITEHGLFNDATTGTLMDRHVFAAINVVSTDSIAFTYELTVSSGG
jgi:hypothetical protein